MKDDGEPMKTIVQKFGGTSVARSASRECVIGHIERARREGYAPVVVVSAMGRKGDPYATDTLLELAQQHGNLPRRELDLLMSCGEIISAAVLCSGLLSKGVDATVLTGTQAGIITDDNYGNATVLAVRSDTIYTALREGRVPIVAGFQGATVRGDITTLGRGGSDTTAAVLGVALGCELVEIYTDVDGIKTADPRIVPDAVTLGRVTYSEAIELAHLGAKVIHPRAVQIAMASRIPLKIRSNHSDAPGTLITSGLYQGPDAVLYPDRPVTGIACVLGQSYVLVHTENDPESRLLDLFDQLGAAGISLDMVHVTQGRVAFTVAGDQGPKTEQVLSRLGLQYHLDSAYAKVSAVGGGMHGVPGVVSRVFRALSLAGVEVFETSDSHANISCLVRQDDVERAVGALHQEFRLNEEQQVYSFKE